MVNRSLYRFFVPSDFHNLLRSFDDFSFLSRSWIGSYDILIGSNNGSSAAVKVTFSLSRASLAKSRKSAELKDLVNPGFTETRGKRRIYSADRFTGRSNPVWPDLA
ncbi:hypothetical protein KFK09_009550 [Dendrobium nobile]|uniref:Uncharacterized protein n=1 Tax=Dendrobium nobile TaxID=94219 RepID=A0A8T3BK97_DENNO|nr:hypothetical protein KFK09_009550 [Dendrobium nobile]